MHIYCSCSFRMEKVLIGNLGNFRTRIYNHLPYAVKIDNIAMYPIKLFHFDFPEWMMYSGLLYS